MSVLRVDGGVLGEVGGMVGEGWGRLVVGERGGLMGWVVGFFL